MWLRRTSCRACGYGKVISPPGIKSAPNDERLIPVYSLGLHPLANAFAKPEELQSAFYPLEILYCHRCTLAQLSATVPAKTLYANYAYVTSKSETMQSHFKALWQAIKLECESEAMCEIGSNDGDFLLFAKANGVSAVCGIDPAENLAEEARKRGLQTFCGIFDQETALMARSSMPAINLIVARHVFCHVDNWEDFVKSLDTMSYKDTLIVIEVPYVIDLLKNVELDTLYHEHTSYLSLKAMEYLLEDSPFSMHKVLRFPIHGGAIVIMLRRRDSGIAPHESVAAMLAAENITERTWRDFADAARNRIWSLQEKVQGLKAKGKTIAAYGASAKATVLINACKFTRKEIQFVTDTTPQKQYCMIPGTDIPVVDPGALLREQPDYTLLTSWNFMEEIMSKERRYRELGGQFIMPHNLTGQ